MIKIFQFKYFLKPILGLILAASMREADLGEKIRIAILENVSGVSIRGDSISFSASQKTYNKGETAQFSAEGKYVVNEGDKYKSPVRVEAGGERIYINDKEYRGEIVLYADNGKLLVVDEIPLEIYLVGLINAETYSSWPIETIKAQAVVARTYALHRAQMNKSNRFDIRSTVMDQVYHGSSLEDDASAAAVFGTKGWVLFYGGSLAETYYHSTCGGSTAFASEVWGNDFAYLKSVPCDWCAESPRYFWSWQADAKQIGEVLAQNKIIVGELKSISAIGRTLSGRNDKIEIIGSKSVKQIAATEFRRILGYTNIFSTRFEVFSPQEGAYKFLGRGSGHGVGMCQWGARGLALEGKTYEEILQYYYGGCSIVQAY